MRKIVAFVSFVFLSSSLLVGCSSSDTSKSETAQESSLGPNGARLGPNALGVNGLPLLPDEAAQGVCFAAFHFFLDGRDPATYEYSEDPAVNGNISRALDVQELWNEIKWMDEKFGTTFAEFALEMGKFAANANADELQNFKFFESENWCNGRAMRVNDGSP